jgi:hypothetical protein
LVEFLYLLLFLFVLLCCAAAVYLLARVLRMYRRARELQAMRGYETILRLALPSKEPEAVVRELLPRVKATPMRRVLARLAQEGDDEWRRKVKEVAGLLGLDLAEKGGAGEC